MDPLPPPSPPMTELRGNSVGRPDKEGGRPLLKILGVVMDIMGVVRESFFAATVLVVAVADNEGCCLVDDGTVSISITGGGEVGAFNR